jgi:hypothetical protein
MTKRFGIFIMIVGLGAIAGCAQSQDDTKKPPAQTSTLPFARAAVEVGEISLGEMEAYQANVEGMTASKRSQLWQRLAQLHGGVHAAESSPPLAAVDEGDEAGCTIRACSHAEDDSVTVQWCCAFGEDKTFFMNDCTSLAGGCGGGEDGGGDQSN